MAFAIGLLQVEPLISRAEQCLGPLIVNRSKHLPEITLTDHDSKPYTLIHLNPHGPKLKASLQKYGKPLASESAAPSPPPPPGRTVRPGKSATDSQRPHKITQFDIRR